MDCGIVQRGAFGKYDQKGRGERRMVRVSECKYLVATVYESSICIHIQKSAAIYKYEEDYENDFEELEKEGEIKAEFTLFEGRYSYLEWSPLNRVYIEGPSFLTLDDKGRLRVHFVKEKTEQVVEPGEVFRCATFSLGGRYIYAINDQQELCKIDLEGLKIVMRRKIEGLSNPEEVMSSHIQQVTPWIFAIGSLMKVDNEGADFKPYFHLVSGDIADENEQLKIKEFEMPLIEAFDSQKPVIFRTLYVKERQLLLFGHTGSNKIRVLHFGLDGVETEIDALSLGTRTLRGIIFMKGKRPRELKNEYQNKQLESSMGPEIVVLDSAGDIHYFRYFNTLSSAPTLSLFMRYLSIKEFMQKQGRLKARLNRTRKNRCKSQHRLETLITSTGQRKKRSKSQVSPSEAKLSSEEKQKTTKFLKENPPNISFRLLKPAENPFLSVKKIENPFLSVQKTENKQTISSLFSTKTEDIKPTTSGLFSSIPSSSIKTTGNSLVGFSSQLDFLFQKAESRNLFGPAPVSTNKFDLFNKGPQSTSSSLFPAKAFQKIPDDPIKKRAMLFLNKLESDVTFKVENQEFPAHKDILSEKCTFFKNMFSSGMSESYAPVIEISDTKAPMFKAFLEYVYMGQAILNEELAMGLFGFSEKYMIYELKESCENYLINILTLKNCFKIFETACSHEVDSLKKKALQFFRDHLKEITENKDFEDLPKETYLYIKRIQWNDKILLDPSFDKFIKN